LALKNPNLENLGKERPGPGIFVFQVGFIFGVGRVIDGECEDRFGWALDLVGL
jgi:hypothetical protein